DDGRGARCVDARAVGRGESAAAAPARRRAQDRDARRGQRGQGDGVVSMYIEIASPARSVASSAPTFGPTSIGTQSWSVRWFISEPSGDARMSWSPGRVPYGADQTIYLVVDSFGAAGAAYRETEVERADLEAVISDLLAGQFNAPVRIVAFNTLE